VIRLTFEYEEKSQVVLTTSDFSSIDDAEAKITGEPSRKMMINSSGTAHLVTLDYKGLLIEDLDTGVAKLVGQGVTRSDPVAESTIVPEEVVETREEPIMEPEVLSPGETTSNFEGGENLPEIPTKFKSFRDFFQEQNRVRNSFLNAIAEKMSKGNEVLKFMDNKLNEENDYVEALREKYLGK
jgi:hypothetical protein